ncbi:uncharacterized protein ACBR49_005610 [Aulostomus maculatus]
MRSLWLLFLVGLATGFLSDKLLVSSQSPSFTPDDLYLEGHTSGDLPIDDEDGYDDGSGSGSGDYDLADTEKMLMRFLNFSSSKDVRPVQPQPTAASPHSTPTREVNKETDTGTTLFISPVDDREEEVPDSAGDWFTERPSPSTASIPPSETTTSDDLSDGRRIIEDPSVFRTNEVDNPEGVISENIWERTEVLAGVIACVVIGFLCAVFLLLLLAYRMKKKDEGSYDLGDTKLSTTAYHKAPTKEFYA